MLRSRPPPTEAPSRGRPATSQRNRSSQGRYMPTARGNDAARTTCPPKGFPCRSTARGELLRAWPSHAQLLGPASEDVARKGPRFCVGRSAPDSPEMPAACLRGTRRPLRAPWRRFQRPRGPRLRCTARRGRTRWSSTHWEALALVNIGRQALPSAPRLPAGAVQTPRRHPRSREDDFEALTTGSA
jgi:hypothetical protein